MYTPETNARITELRYKAAQHTITQDELAEAVRLLRGERKSSVVAAAKRKSAAAKAVKSADDLLNELEGM